MKEYQRQKLNSKIQEHAGLIVSEKDLELMRGKHHCKIERPKEVKSSMTTKERAAFLLKKEYLYIEEEE